jgi:hypothetical protein
VLDEVGGRRCAYGRRGAVGAGISHTLFAKGAARSIGWTLLADFGPPIVALVTLRSIGAF